MVAGAMGTAGSLLLPWSPSTAVVALPQQPPWLDARDGLSAISSDHGSGKPISCVVSWSVAVTTPSSITWREAVGKTGNRRGERSGGGGERMGGGQTRR